MLLSGSIEGARDDHGDESRDIEDSRLGSLNGMCGGNEYEMFYGRSLLDSL